jgi:hypothetical protein
MNELGQVYRALDVPDEDRERLLKAMREETETTLEKMNMAQAEYERIAGLADAG